MASLAYTRAAEPDLQASQETRQHTRHAKRPSSAALARVDEPTDAAPSDISPRQVPGTEPTSVPVHGTHRPTPFIGTREWELEQAARERDERHLNAALQSICRGC